jgi:hypothetical protein
MMKALLMTTAIIEITTGNALPAVPALHTALSIWSIACLRRVGLQGIIQE